MMIILISHTLGGGGPGIAVDFVLFGNGGDGHVVLVPKDLLVQTAGFLPPRGPPSSPTPTAVVSLRAS